MTRITVRPSSPTPRTSPRCSNISARKPTKAPTACSPMSAGPTARPAMLTELRDVASSAGGLDDSVVPELGRSRLPTRHQLAAALLAAAVLSDDGTRIGDARDSYATLPTGGLYRSRDLAAGERILLEVGLLWEEAGVLYPSRQAHLLARLSEREGIELLLALLLEREPPVWLAGVVGHDGVSLE